MLFKKRKSRKELLKEIEQLEFEKRKYFDYWVKETERLYSINKTIKAINAVCINNSDEPNQEMIKECLCNQLAKEIIPYVTFETYKMVGEPWDGDAKHIATVHIVE